MNFISPLKPKAKTPEQSAAAIVAAQKAAEAARPKIPKPKSALNSKDRLDTQYTVSAPKAIKAPEINAGQLDINALKADPAALNAIKARAMGTEDSPWLKMQLEKQKLGELGAMDTAGQGALTDAAVARSSLAMKGGLSGGARERIAMGAGRNLNAARQGVARAGQQDRLGLNIAEDATKTDLLKQIPGMDLNFANQATDLSKYNTGMAFDAARLNAGMGLDTSRFNSGNAFDANKLNANNTLGALSQDNLNKLGIYSEQMKGYAADKQGNAIAGSGKK